MADKKITQLTNITGANLVDADEFVVVDISADETKAITLGELKEAFDSGSGFVRITGDTMTGDLALSGADVTFGDNDKAIFGAGSDLEIYHDASDGKSYIRETGSGNFEIRATNLRLKTATGGNYLAADAGGAVTAYYDGSPKLYTTSTGIDVTGNATFADNGKAIFGAGSDLQIYHDGSNSYVDEVGAGVLKVRSNGTGIDFESTGGETLAQFVTNGAVTLYHNNAAKLATTSTGIDVTGTVTADGLTVDGDATIGQTSGGDRTLSVGSAGALHFDIDTVGTTGRVYLNATNDSTAGKIHLQTADLDRLFINNNGDISFYDSQGSSQSFFWDADAESLGIGTSSPSELLEVNSTGSSAAIEVSAGQASTTTGEAKIVLRSLHSSSGTTYSRSEIASLGVAGGDSDLIFRTTTQSSGPAEHMRIDSEGNVGIGTSAPSTRLDVSTSTSTIATFRVPSGGGANNKRLEVATGGDRVIFKAYTDSDSSAAAIAFNNGATSEAMRIDSSGNVGIGTSSPAQKLHVYTDGGGSQDLLFLQNNAAGDNHYLKINVNNTANEVGYISSGTSGGAHVFYRTASTEAMRLDSSGNLLVGKTSSSINTQGVDLRADGQNYFVRNNGTPIFVNRQTSDGTLLDLRKDGNTVGSIGAAGTNLLIDGGSAKVGLAFRGAEIRPRDDGADDDGGVDLGSATYRFNDIYATNGTIQTSDRNEKQDIEVLSDAEQRVAVAAKGLLRKFRWIDAVEEKGDEARTHFGIIAQDLQAAFAAEGLDAGDYAMFTSSTWTDEDTGEERTRMGVRYSELLAFIIAAI